MNSVFELKQPAVSGPPPPGPPSHEDILNRVAQVEEAVASLRRLGYALGAGVLASTAPESWLGRIVAAVQHLGGL